MEEHCKEIRQEWLQNCMAKEMYVDQEEEMRIFVGTYNVNAKKLDGALDDWLFPEKLNMDDREGERKPVDIYAIGFQEIVDLNAVNVALDGSQTKSRSEYWTEKISSCLKQKAGQERYVLLTSKALVGVLLCIFARESLVSSSTNSPSRGGSDRSYITDLRSTSCATGVAGMGNKGGVCVRLSIGDSSLCFIAGHLAAHRENVGGRNDDFWAIMEQARFLPSDTAAGYKQNQGAYDNSGFGRSTNPSGSSLSGGSSFPRPPVSAKGSDTDFPRGKGDRDRDRGRGSPGVWIEKPATGRARDVTRELRISDHSHVFFCGDLNYRIDESLTHGTDKVIEILHQSQNATLNALPPATPERGVTVVPALASLARYDQLCLQVCKPL